MAKNTRRASSGTTKQPRASRTPKTPKVSTVGDNNAQKIMPTRNRLKCKNQKQKQFAKLITDKEIVIASGPAGTGKSYVAIARAIELLQNSSNPYKKIIISKPAIEAEEKHGFLPGDMKEKMEPYVASSVDIIDKILGQGTRNKLVEAGLIQIEALAYIRGKSIDNAILIMEEAQNMSPNQVKTLLTRIGDNSKFVISGDIDQSDKYRDVTQSGLYDIMARHRNIEEIGFFEFDIEDIVRNPIICKILKNYGADTKTPKKLVEFKKTGTKKKTKFVIPVKNKQNTLMSRIKRFFKKIF